MIVRDFLICLLQMYLLEDLEKNMLPYRRENFLGKFLVYFVIALVMLGINHLESSIFNMVMIPVTYMIVSMVVFRGNIWKKLVIVCCYYVLAIIPEFLFATLTNAYGVTGASEGFGTEIEKTLALLLMSTMTFLFIKCINQVTRKRDYLTIENKTFTVLLMLPTATIIILGCVFYSNISFEGMNRVMVPVGASLLLLTNIFIFSVFDRFVEKSEEVKKMARLYQKSRAEIANLQYMNKVNEDNRAFLHDINKFICTVAGLMEEGENQEVKEIMANMICDKEIIALEPSAYMRTAFMARLMEHNEVKERISLLPIDVGKYSFRDKISGVMCMGVLGHLKRDEQEKLLYKLDKNLNINVPILIELLEPKFLVAPVGSRISVATQGRLRYETYITDIKQVGMDQWTWRLTYKVFCGKNIVSTVDSLMSWNYQSVEKILNQLTKMHFRTAKLSETLLLAIKAR